jgi:hypothetical protein
MKPDLLSDARPDHAPWSTDQRMGVAVMGALDNIRAVVNINAVIAQRQALEDNFFSEAARTFSNEREITLINLSASAVDVMWLAELDAEALSGISDPFLRRNMYPTDLKSAAWDKVPIEMLIRVPEKSSASVIRLLRSLKRADYLNSKPRLIIELPSRPDPMLLRYLQILKQSNWAEEIIVRGRVNPHQLTLEESAARTAESYIPFDSPCSSVLVLSPQVELSPSFFHFLKYAVLKYKHSTSAKGASSQLVGISLELPSRTLTEDETFSLPSSMADDMLTLWQSPNSNAALYFGDRWEEFQNFLSQRFSHDSAGDSRPRYVDKKHPAFVGYFLELMRARGYYMLYPLFSTTQDLCLATVHNELYQPPEEFRDRGLDRLGEEINEHDVEELKKEGVWELGSVENSVNHQSTLRTLLSRMQQGLPKLDTLQLLSYDGQIFTYDTSYREAMEFGNTFRARFGGCRESETGDILLREPWVVDNLFCTVES